MTTYLEDLAAYLQGPVIERITPRELNKAATCVVDAIACARAGSRSAWVNAAFSVASGGGSEASIWSRPGHSAGVLDAAYVNAVAAHSIVQEDMHPASRSHPGTMVIPTALALAERDGRTVWQTLQAVIVGYEAIARVSEVMTTPEFVRRGFRPSSVLGPFGAAATAANLLELDRAHAGSALAMAASVSAGTCEWASSGSTEAFFQVANAARGGLLAALLASEGMTGPPSAIDGPAGLAQALSGGMPAREGDALVDSGAPLAINDVYFKAYASCAFTQEAIQASVKLVTDTGLDPEQIQSIRVDTYRMAKDYPGVDNPTSLDAVLERQMSTQFAVAAAVLDGELALNRYVGPLGDDIADLASRVSIEVSEESESAYPAAHIVSVSATLRDGTMRSARVTDGGYLDADGVSDKFRSVSPDLSTATVDKFVADLAGGDETTLLSQVLAPIQRPPA